MVKSRLHQDKDIERLESRLFLSDVLTPDSSLLIKFNSFLNQTLYTADPDCARYSYEFTPGSFLLPSCPKIKYCNLQMERCEEERLQLNRSGAKKIIRIREFIFIDAQAFVRSKTGIFKLKDDNGFMLIKLSKNEHRSVLRQLSPMYKDIWTSNI
jgi:hypothetical protein